MLNPVGLKTRFLNYPIRRKLMLIVLVTSVMVMGMTTVIFYVEDMLSFRGHEVEHRRALAEMVCRDTMSAILSNNRAHAEETLQSLAGDPHIQSAWVVCSTAAKYSRHTSGTRGRGGCQRWKQAAG